MKRELVCRQVFDSEKLNSLSVCIENEVIGWEYSLDLEDITEVDPE